MGFFGTFIDGPYAGMSFYIDDGEGGDDFGGYLAAIGVGVVLGAIFIAIAAPLLVWPVFFAEFSQDLGPVVPIIGAICELAFCIWRYRECVRKWNAKFLGQWIWLTAFNALLLPALIFGTAIYYDVAYSLGVDWGEGLAQMMANGSFGNIFSLTFVAAAMAVLPTLAVTKLADRTMEKVTPSHVKK